MPPGSPTALELAVVAGDGIGVFALPVEGTVTLGRDKRCNVRIDNPSVSRRHAILHLGQVLRIEDLGSANGTFVRDARPLTDNTATVPLRKLSKESFEIEVGDRVNLGAISLIVRRVVPDTGHAGATAERRTIVRDPEVQKLYDQVGRAARSTISVLLLGETGVGKELFARAVHERSPRSGGPFLPLNCTTIAPALIEGELFGHEKGAFTGATHAQPGLLEAADQGTIFLDEIGELPVTMQIKLLRVLEDQMVLRAGGRTPRKIDVRFVAATNRDLETEIERGTFRQDLYFRLNGFCVTIPPLRDRVIEIGPLANQFLTEASARFDRSTPLQLSPDALGYLERYSWPGNVRELRNAMERAAVLASGDLIVPADLPASITGARRAGTPTADRQADASRDAEKLPGSTSASPGTDPDGRTERQRIIDALTEFAGNQTRAAAALGISLRTLATRLDQYGISRPRKPRP